MSIMKEPDWDIIGTKLVASRDLIENEAKRRKIRYLFDTLDAFCYIKLYDVTFSESGDIHVVSLASWIKQQIEQDFWSWQTKTGQFDPNTIEDDIAYVIYDGINRGVYRYNAATKTVSLIRPKTKLEQALSNRGLL